MTVPDRKSWRYVKDEVRRRINARHWKPGELIPKETELSDQFGCARGTVNRALRSLAEEGLLDRRRRAGTRVARNPVRKATLEIPVIRDEIEKRGLAYQYSRVGEWKTRPPAAISARMQVHTAISMLRVLAVHLADGHPYVLEDRWINLEAVPGAARADFSRYSPNEWLVANVPFEGGDFSFSATPADKQEADMLACEPGDALFVIDRTTWNERQGITCVSLRFRPGYRMHTRIRAD